ncbi:MAG: hypothetical protein AB1489_30790, partial [Acidobacteriota bacterium]
MVSRKSVFVSAIVFSLLTCVFISSTTSSNTNPTPQRLNPNQAAVNISLDGMVLIALGDPERASIGILNAMHHTPLLTITKIQGNNRSTIAT